MLLPLRLEHLFDAEVALRGVIRASVDEDVSLSTTQIESMLLSLQFEFRYRSFDLVGTVHRLQV